MRKLFIDTNEVLLVMPIGNFYKAYSPRLGKYVISHKSNFKEFKSKEKGG